jgi:hypothetical protein
MIYITYDEYVSEFGGTLDSTAFNRTIDRACGVIDNETRNRVANMKEMPRQVKACCRDLTEYLHNNSTLAKSVSSKSQSAGGVSESESYSEKTAEDMFWDIMNILYDYIGSLTDDNGTPLLYRGAMR